MKGTLSAALFYADLGWPVIPVWPVDEKTLKCKCGKDHEDGREGKHPIYKVGKVVVAKRGLLDATTNKGLIRKWWKVVPDANIGVRGDKFFALDVDDHDGLFELEGKYGKLPDTVESVSGSGGRHILFKQPENGVLGNEEGGLPDGINVRGRNGYIIVPPSMHRSGSRYIWELSSHPRDVKLADAPEWLIELIGESSSPESIGPIQVSDSVPNIDRVRVSAYIKSLVKSAPDPDEDRSSTDQKAIVAMLSAGLTPQQVKAVFSNYPIGTQGKYAERGDRYLDRSIERAIPYVKSSTNVEVKSHITDKVVTPHEAAKELHELNLSYLRGWRDAMKVKIDAIRKMWPQYLSVDEASAAYYQLGFRSDFMLEGCDGVYPALVVPYHIGGEVKNIGYELYGQPSSSPNRIWENGTNVFDSNIDGSGMSGTVFLTEDWDTAAATYLWQPSGSPLSSMDILGVPRPTGDRPARLASLQELASLLAGSERVVVAWPNSRNGEARKLNELMGGGRVYWIDMPAPMRDMYVEYGMKHNHLVRYISHATAVG